ncbi:hypothetical protein Tco_1474303 [Tanacetum coccineum]
MQESTLLGARPPPCHIITPTYALYHLLPSSGCLTQIQTLKIASTQALIDAVTASLPSPLLPPPLYIPPPIDRRDDIPESEQPPRKRLCLSTLGSKYEIRREYYLPDLPRRGSIMGLSAPEEVNTRVIELSEPHEHEHGLCMLYLRCSAIETFRSGGREAYASREAWAHSIGLSQATHQELQTHRDHVYAHETHLQAHQTQLQLQGTLIQTQHQVHETRFQMQQAKIAALRETDRRRQEQMVETLHVIRDIRREMDDMQAELLALREQRRRARQPAPDVRIPDHQDASRDVDSHV